jgi:hypothetical protein
MNTGLNTIEMQIADIEAKFENHEDMYDCDQQVVDLEQELELWQSASTKDEILRVKSLVKRLKKLREDLDIFDPEAERKFMFPNEEDDFDNDY